MLTREENELLCRVGADRPMGQMLRRYWLPALLSEELPTGGCRPRRVRLLGEHLVAFRDSEGKVGLLDEHCPHRGSSLYLGRNEGDGLRCIYHGWKIGTDGCVLDTPVEPAETAFKERVKAISYPTVEQGDVVWAYIGPPDKIPQFPRYAWTLTPPTHHQVLKVWEECNWVQALEGALDASHAAVLHAEQLLPSDRPRHTPTADLAPRLEAENTDYGFRFAAIHVPLNEPEKYKLVRTFNFAAPCHVFTPPKDTGSMHIFVPMDDYNTMWFGVNFTTDAPLAFDRQARAHDRGALLGVDLDANYRKLRRYENDYLQDVAAMESATSFSGLSGQATQDHACQETMGPIYDRTLEHLGTTDVGIIRMRRRMLDAVRAFEAGEEPLGINPNIPYERVGTDERLIPLDAPWQVVGAFADETVPAGASHTVQLPPSLTSRV